MRHARCAVLIVVVARISALYLHRDNVHFTPESTSPLASSRSYGSLLQAALENRRSRIYGGIHHELSNQEGLMARRALADYIWANYLRPDRGRRH